MDVGVEYGWQQLRQHLDWTRGYPSLVFVTAGAQTLIDDIARRLALYADIRHLHFDEVIAHDEAVLAPRIPVDGIVLVRVAWRDEVARYRVLRALNELRSRLSSAGAGCLVVVGPTALRAEAAVKSADLWAVRSFALALTGRPSEIRSLEPSEEPPPEKSDALRFPRIQVPAGQRTAGSATVLRLLERAGRLAWRDERRAMQVAHQAFDASKPGTFARGLAGLARAELAARAGDPATAEIALTMMREDAGRLDQAARRRLFVPATDIARITGRLDLALALATDVAADARDLADRSGTPEALRDLSVSLNNVGGVARARGDLPGERDCVREALDALVRSRQMASTPGDENVEAALRRRLAELSGTGER